MDWIITAVMGLIVGGLAKFIMPGEQPGGFLGTVAFGIVGSFLGKFIFGMLGMGTSNMYFGFIISLIGAILLIYIWEKYIGPIINKQQ